MPVRGARRPSALVLHLALVGGLLAVSVALWWRVWLAGDPGSTITCQCGDPAQYLWFVAWVPWSLGHLHDPFLSQAIYAGQGGSNTLEISDLLPPLVVSPVTVLFGPIAAFNVLVTLVPVVNGWSLFLLARKVTSFVPGQLIAALLYGFSPFVIHDLPYGHFNVDLVYFPPLALWCVYDLLVAHRHRPVKVGLLLGGLCVAQFFTGTELLATSAVMAALGALIALAVAPRLVLANLRPAAVGLGVGVVSAGAVLAYPLWVVLAGPRHVVGQPWPATAFYGFSPSAVVESGSLGLAPTIGGYYGTGVPPAFLGLALVVLLAIAAPLWGRRRLAWCAAAAGVLGWAFALGADDGETASWGPWRIFDRLPIVGDILPGRFALVADLAAALLLALTLDVLWARRDRLAALLRRSASRRGGWLAGAFGCAVAVLALVPVAGVERPFAVHHDPVPPWISLVGPTLPAGDVVLVMPDASSAATQAMAWQADDDFRFAMVGGEAQVPGADGHDSIHVDPPTGPQALITALSWGLGPEPPVSPADVASVRDALRSWGVQVVVVTKQTRDIPYAVGVLTEVLGRAPQYVDDAWVWYGLGGSPPLSVAATALRSCAAHAHIAVAPLNVVSCVMSVASTGSAGTTAASAGGAGSAAGRSSHAPTTDAVQAMKSAANGTQ
jgi:hypothetical protein